MSKTNGHKPAAIYLRRSTDRQMQSIGDQRTAIERYADQHGYRIVSEYVDDAVSGTRVDGRLGLQRMMRDALSPQPSFRTVLVYDVSRFSRADTYEMMSQLNILYQNGVEFIPVSTPLPGTEFDGVMLALLGITGHQEVVTTSQKTLMAQSSRAQDGCWMGGRAPFGYDLAHMNAAGETYSTIRSMHTGEKHVFDSEGKLHRVLKKGERLSRSKEDTTRLTLSTPERVATIQRIFALYEAGRGYNAIADLLNSEGLKSPRNGNYSRTGRAGWSQSTIKSIIDNPIYTGAIVWNRKTGAALTRLGRPAEG